MLSWFGPSAVQQDKCARLLFVLCTAFLVQGCAARGPASDPVSRVLSWFSYMNGDDLRSACARGATDRYRLIYNGRWTEQVRSYDLVAARALPGTQGQAVPVDAKLMAQSFTPAPLFNAYLERLNGGDATQVEEVRLEPDDFRRLEGAISEIASRMDGEGSWLRSDRYFWLIMGCRDGEFRLTGFEVTPEIHDGLVFLAPLIAVDPVAGPLARPRALPEQPYAQTAGQRERREVRFRVQVRDNRLVGQ